MNFESLKEKCEYYRSLQDTKLIPGLYTLAMIDGRSFSKYIKKKYKLPFDDKFIKFMNETAKYVCENVQGVKLAYVQSDEISFLLSDYDTPETESFFGYRTCKLLSLIAGLGTGIFNKLQLLDLFENYLYGDDEEAYLDILQKDEYNKIINYIPVEFDCKIWQVPTQNDAFAWFLYRQNDCIRNSKNQVGNFYLSHKQMMGKKADDVIQELKDSGTTDWWHDYSDGKKYGRLIWKEPVQIKTPGKEVVERQKFMVHDAYVIRDNKEKFLSLIPKNE